MVARVVRTFEGLSLSSVDWPVLVMEFPEQLLKDADLQAGLAYLEQLLKQGRDASEKTYSVIDLSRMHQLAPASQRKFVAEWMERTVPLQKASSLGAANVTPSSILRGFITAIYWLVPPPVPSIFVPTRRDAYAEALKAFDAARIALPATLRSTLGART